MDGGFFSLEAMTGGPVLQTVSPATTTAPEFNFVRGSSRKVRDLAMKAAEDAPPGLTTAQINRLTEGAFEAHHPFPVQVFGADEGSSCGGHLHQ